MGKFGTITAKLSALPQIGVKAMALDIMRQDLGSLWSFLAPTRIVYRKNNLDYLAETRRPRVPTYNYPADKEIKNCDVILALGSNDLTTPHQAARLYQLISGTNPQIKIVTSGKGGHTTVPKPIFNMAEAERYMLELSELGVPKDNILADLLSENSGANITNSYSLLHDLGLALKRVAIVQTPAAQLRANLAFEKQWLDKDWDYYISSPPALPSIKSLPDNEVDYYLAYALREAMTTYYYINGPVSSSGSRFVTKLDFPPQILAVIDKYGKILFGEDQSLEQLYNGFRSNFNSEEIPYLKP